MPQVNVIGAGLAGSEAALQLADRGVEVNLYDCKPTVMSPAHHSADFAEVVCSNSFKSTELSSASGLFKAELDLLGCKLLKVARQCRVPAGGALAVDRENFSREVTTLLTNHKKINIIYKEVSDLPQGINIICTGPLTTPSLCKYIQSVCGEFLHFFDAAAPIVTAESIDMQEAFVSDRYDKGEGDYVNCPLDKQQFEYFWEQLVSAQTAQVKDFEKSEVFESCMPIEVMAKRGQDTIRFGPLKPVGLIDPKTGKRPYAVVQLRKEDMAGIAYNLVGFQTHLTFGEQKRVFGLIPALKNAEFIRYGVMHKNIFIDSGKVLDNAFALKTNKNVYFAGQITGVEGYVESIGSGLVSALNCFRRLNGLTDIDLGDNTIVGCLARYILSPKTDFQPMNANFGLLPPLDAQIRDKKLKKLALAERSLNELKTLII